MKPEISPFTQKEHLCEVRKVCLGIKTQLQFGEVIPIRRAGKPESTKTIIALQGGAAPSNLIKSLMIMKKTGTFLLASISGKL